MVDTFSLPPWMDLLYESLNLANKREFGLDGTSSVRKPQRYTTWARGYTSPKLREETLCAYNSRDTILSHVFHIHQIIASQGENSMVWDTLLLSIVFIICSNVHMGYSASSIKPSIQTPTPPTCYNPDLPMSSLILTTLCWNSSLSFAPLGI